MVDVARAVRVDALRRHPDDQLGPRPLVDERVVQVDVGLAVDPHAVLPLEVDEEHPDGRVLQHVAERQVHPVAVVVRERDRALVDHPHETGITALVRDGRLAVGVARGEEEHVARFDERPVRVAERVLDEHVLDAVGQPPGVEPVLQPPVLVAVDRHGTNPLSASAP